MSTQYDDDPRVLPTVSGWAFTWEDTVYYVRPVTDANPQSIRSLKLKDPADQAVAAQNQALFDTNVLPWCVVSADATKVFFHASPDEAISFFLGAPQPMAVAS